MNLKSFQLVRHLTPLSETPFLMEDAISYRFIRLSLLWTVEPADCCQAHNSHTPLWETFVKCYFNITLFHGQL